MASAHSAPRGETEDATSSPETTDEASRDPVRPFLPEDPPTDEPDAETAGHVAVLRTRLLKLLDDHDEP